MLDESRCEYITNWRDRQHYANDGHKTGKLFKFIKLNFCLN